MRSVCFFVLLWPLAAQQYDLVIRNGRVLDPESNLDAIRDVAISAGKIRSVSAAPLPGRETIDASGLVVAPGFIDLHAHGQDAENYRAEAQDGVTTALELEVGVADVDAWYDSRQGDALINYGAAVGHIPIRMRIMRDPGRFLPVADAAHRAATEEEITECKHSVEHGLLRGAVGVGLGIQYTPAATRWEVLEMFRVAARQHAACFVHMRNSGEDSVAALQEIIADSALTGTPVHVAHITSNGLRITPRLLDMMAEARARNVDVTTELYPYTAAMTSIESAMFDSGWQSTLGIGYNDLQWAETGERLTADSFERYRRAGGGVIIHMIPETALQSAMASPFTIIASDGGLRGGKGHPRSSGTFSRILGRYARETHALTLMEAIRKMTLMPAERLQARVPAMRDKGRVREGADADLTVFDPATVSDAATYNDPGRHSTGIRYVLVHGIPVVRNGRLQKAFPGAAVRAPVH
ncbi:MAG: amidohydrolase family protein [Bryobacteraceae bacterium]